MEIKVFNEKEHTNSFFCYISDFISITKQKELLEWLNNFDDFKCNPSGSNYEYSRLQKRYQMDNKYFCPKWRGKFDWWSSFEYDTTLLKLQKDIEIF